MAQFQPMHKYGAFFLVLIACHGFLLTHARQIKTVDSSLKPSINVPSSPEKKLETPEKPDYKVADSEGSSGAGNTNAFRPITPGKSPGVGHKKFAGEDKDMNAKVAVHSPDFEHYDTQNSKDDFRPTNPGHSPGVGHMLEN